MKKNDIISVLIPGVIVGLVLGFSLGMLVGVNEADKIPNFIGAGVACLVPTLLNCVIVLKQTAKKLKRDLTIPDALKRTLPFALGSLLFGVLFVFLVLEVILLIDIRTISPLVNAIIQALLGVVVSTVCAFFALKKYEKDVKYTKRNKKA